MYVWGAVETLKESVEKSDDEMFRMDAGASLGVIVESVGDARSRAAEGSRWASNTALLVWSLFIRDHGH